MQPRTPFCGQCPLNGWGACCYESLIWSRHKSGCCLGHLLESFCFCVVNLYFFSTNHLGNDQTKKNRLPVLMLADLLQERQKQLRTKTQQQEMLTLTQNTPRWKSRFSGFNLPPPPIVFGQWKQNNKLQRLLSSLPHPSHDSLCCSSPFVRAFWDLERSDQSAASHWCT